MLAGELIYKITADARDLNRALDKADTQGKTRGTQFGKALGSSISQGLNTSNISFQQPLQRAFSQAEGTVRSGTSRLGSVMTSVFQGIGIGIAGTLTNAIGSAVSAGISQVKSLATTVYNVGSAAESLKISFRTIIGDTAKADKLLADMRKFSAQTPFTGSEVQNASQKLLTVVKPEDMINTLRRLGDVAAGTRSQLGDLATIYQQVLSKGKLQAEEMIQFAERGIPIQEAVAKVLGVQVNQVSELGSKGKITADVMIKAFAQLADEGGKFNGIMEKQSQTVAGMASTLQDGFEQAAGAVFTKLEPALKAVLESMSSAGAEVSKNTNFMDLFGEAASKVAAFLSRHKTEINAAVVAMAQFVEGGLKAAINAAGGLYNWIQKNPPILQEITRQTQLWGSGMRLIWDFAQKLAPAFQLLENVATAILKVFNDLAEKFQFIVNKSKELVGVGSTAEFGGSETIQGQDYQNQEKLSITAPSGKPIVTAKDLTKHHNNRKPANPGDVIHDYTLWKGNRTDVPIASPLSGTVVEAGTGYNGGWGGRVAVRSEDNRLFAAMAHLADVMVKVGDKVIAGQTLGIQGDTGRSQGVHVDFEGNPQVLAEYIKAQRSGDYSRLASMGRRGGAGRSWTPANTGSIPTDTRNAAALLAVIRQGESSLDDKVALTQKNPNSTARGPYQFIDSTRERILKSTGLDAWKPDRAEQNAAALALIKKDAPQAYTKMMAGDIEGAAELLNKIWPSLPGGSQSKGFWSKNSVSGFLAKQTDQSLAPYTQGLDRVLGGSPSSTTSTTSSTSTPTTGKPVILPKEEKAKVETRKKDIAAAIAKNNAENQKAFAEIQKNLAGIRDAAYKAADNEYAETLKIISADVSSGAITQAEAATLRSQAGTKRQLAKDSAQKTYLENLKRRQDEQKEELKRRNEEAQRNLEQSEKINQEILQGQTEVSSLLASISNSLVFKRDAEIKEIDTWLKGEELSINQRQRSGDLTASQAASLKGIAQQQATAKRSAVDKNFETEIKKLDEERNRGVGERISEAVRLSAEKARESSQSKGSLISAMIDGMNQRYAAEDAAFGSRQNIGQMALQLAQARAGAITDPDKARTANIAAGRQGIELNLASQIQQIEQLGRSGLYTKEELRLMKEQAHEISQIQIEGLNKQFLSLGDTIKNTVGKAFADLIHSLVMGESVLGSFSQMFASVASSLATLGIQSLFGGLGIPAFADGGLVADGGRRFKSIDQAMRWEKWATGQKPQLAVVNQGEKIIPAFASGLNISGSPKSSININLGEWHLDKTQDPAKLDRLQGVLKETVYGIIMHERRQGGLLH